MLRILSALRAGRLSYVPVGRDWAERLPQLQGHFRRSKYENFGRVFGAAVALALAIFMPMVEMSRGTWPVDLLDPFHIVLTAAMVVLAVFLLWPIGRSYVLKDGEMSCVSWRGRVLWREDLRGLEYVTCAGGGVRSPIMSLKWPDRRRRIDLFESLEKALSEHHH